MSVRLRSSQWPERSSSALAGRAQKTRLAEVTLADEVLVLGDELLLDTGEKHAGDRGRFNEKQKRRTRETCA